MCVEVCVPGSQFEATPFVATVISSALDGVAVQGGGGRGGLDVLLSRYSGGSGAGPESVWVAMVVLQTGGEEEEEEAGGRRTCSCVFSLITSS